MSKSVANPFVTLLKQAAGYATQPTLSEVVAQKLREKNMSVADLATAMGLSEEQMKLLLTGTQALTDEQKAQMATTLGMPLAEVEACCTPDMTEMSAAKSESPVAKVTSAFDYVAGTAIALGLSPQDVATAAGCDVPTLMAALDGTSALTDEQVAKMAAVLKVEVEALKAALAPGAAKVDLELRGDAVEKAASRLWVAKGTVALVPAVTFFRGVEAAMQKVGSDAAAGLPFDVGPVVEMLRLAKASAVMAEGGGLKIPIVVDPAQVKTTETSTPLASAKSGQQNGADSGFASNASAAGETGPAAKPPGTPATAFASTVAKSAQRVDAVLQAARDQLAKFGGGQAASPDAKAAGGAAAASAAAASDPAGWPEDMSPPTSTRGVKQQRQKVDFGLDPKKPARGALELPHQ